MGDVKVVSMEDISTIATEIAKLTINTWDERARAAEQRIYGWKAIAAEVERLRGQPCSVVNIRRWWKSKRFPIDKDPLGYSVTRGELDRWLRAAPAYPRAK